jgi:hypothetical protein
MALYCFCRPARDANIRCVRCYDAVYCSFDCSRLNGRLHSAQCVRINKTQISEELGLTMAHGEVHGIVYVACHPLFAIG